ncbi:peptidoglycan DD-metalloendopeptidase family protein [Peptococcaceae bacterium 1198_IL3148]
MPYKAAYFYKHRKLIIYLIAGFILSVMLLAATIFMLLAFLFSNQGISGSWEAGDPSALIRGQIPANYMQIFLEAQEKYKIPWNILAAICKIETEFGQNVAVSSAGAIGIMQFMPGTWEAYKQDGDNDGQYDPYNPWDAIFSAANYLKSNNFNEDPSKAIYRYNNSWLYVREVTATAERYNNTIIPSGKGAWPLPPQFRDITSYFGYRYHPVDKEWKNHDGIDVAAPGGTAVYTAQPGKVISAGWSGGYGYLVIVAHDDGSTSYYAHLSAILVSRGDEIDRTKPLGLVGSTGVSTGDHLHFEVRLGGRKIDPLPWVDAAVNDYI